MERRNEERPQLPKWLKIGMKVSYRSIYKHRTFVVIGKRPFIIQDKDHPDLLSIIVSPMNYGKIERI